MIELRAALTFDQSDNEEEVDLKDHRTPNNEESYGVLEYKFDLRMHGADYKQRFREFVEFDSHPNVEQCQQEGDEGQESRDSQGVTDDKNESSDFYLQPISSSPSLHTYEWEGQSMVSIENEVQTLSRLGSSG